MDLAVNPAWARTAVRVSDVSLHVSFEQLRQLSQRGASDAGTAPPPQQQQVSIVLTPKHSGEIQHLQLHVYGLSSIFLVQNFQRLATNNTILLMCSYRACRALT